MGVNSIHLIMKELAWEAGWSMDCVWSPYSVKLLTPQSVTERRSATRSFLRKTANSSSSQSLETYLKTHTTLRRPNKPAPKSFAEESENRNSFDPSKRPRFDESVEYVPTQPNARAIKIKFDQSLQHWVNADCFCSPFVSALPCLLCSEWSIDSRPESYVFAGSGLYK